LAEGDGDIVRADSERHLHCGRRLGNSRGTIVAIRGEGCRQQTRSRVIVTFVPLAEQTPAVPVITAPVLAFVDAATIKLEPYGTGWGGAPVKLTFGGIFDAAIDT
jgi:hypothetical protein